MESLIALVLADIRLAWLLYGVSAVLGYLCWCWMFFWVRRESLWRSLCHWPAWVLLFTQAPVSHGQSHFSPAFVISAFALLNEEMEALEAVGIWWAIGGLSATLYFLVVFIVRESLKILVARRTTKSS